MEKASHKANVQCAEDIGKASTVISMVFITIQALRKNLSKPMAWSESNMLLLITSSKSLTMEGSAKRIRPGHCRAK